jgi:hypothetical protein
MHQSNYSTYRFTFVGENWIVSQWYNTTMVERTVGGRTRYEIVERANAIQRRHYRSWRRQIELNAKPPQEPPLNPPPGFWQTVSEV